MRSALSILEAGRWRGGLWIAATAFMDHRNPYSPEELHRVKLGHRSFITRASIEALLDEAFAEAEEDEAVWAEQDEDSEADNDGGASA